MAANGTIPSEIQKADLDKWYCDLNDSDKMIIARYLSDCDTTSHFSLLENVISKSLVDENYNFAQRMCEEMFNFTLNDYETFRINEHLIEAYFGGNDFVNAKAVCESNFALFPSIAKEFFADNKGEIPERVNFRNKYIDIIVGIDSNYDLADKMLVEYNKMGLLSDSDLEYRKQSLKTHRLQKLFDGVYTYRPVGEDR